MKKRFTSSAFIDATAFSSIHEAGIDLRALPAFLRVLLTTDGTVTKSLQAYFWEPVMVENLGQDYRLLQEDAPAIDLQKGARVLHRSVQLRGAESDLIYTTARSLLRTELLASQNRTALEEGKVGVGELLRDSGLETYREIVALGQNKNQQGEVDRIWRRYRIIMHQQPCIQITEEFPLKAFIRP